MKRTSNSASLTLRSFLGLLLSLSFLMTLTACGGGNTDGKVHLTMWYWNRSISDNLIKQVNQRFPNIELEAVKINDYDNKVRTAMAGRNGVPDIMGINSNISTYFPDEDQFVDLRTLGADEVKSQYLEWKWNLGIAPDGKMIGFPMDTGPTALFYRADLFAKAGLPTDPQAVSAQIKTWDDYIQAGEKMKTATQGKIFMFDNAGTIYTQMLAQSPKQYFEPSGTYIADQQHIKQYWNEAAKAAKLGLSSKTPLWGASWNQAMSNGLVASFVGAVWMKQVLQDAAPKTAGKWRIAYAPGGAGNNGGSFLGITQYSQYPKEAFEVVKWLQSPENQLVGYKDMQLYPSTLSTLDDPSMHQKEAFYGNEDTTTIFSDTAKKVPQFYLGPANDIVNSALNDQISLIDYQNMNPDQAWISAQQRIQRELLR